MKPLKTYQVVALGPGYFLPKLLNNSHLVERYEVFWELELQMCVCVGGGGVGERSKY